MENQGYQASRPKEVLIQTAPVVLITGCSSGIGYETALLLAREGWRVFASMRDPRKAGPLREAARGLPLEVVVLDVDRPDSVRRALAQVLRRTGRLDALVNNAGWGAFGALDEFTDRELRAQYATNLLGLMRVTRAVLPTMRRQGSGRILNIGSLAGRMTFAGVGLYCSTKYAVEAVTEGLRTELRPFGVQAAVLEPGSIRTPFKVNRRKAAVFLSGRSAHQAVLQKVLEFGNKTSPWTPGPKAVARKVRSLLASGRMPVRTTVGPDAFWFPWVQWLLPAFLYDRMMAVLYRRFGSGPALPSHGPMPRETVALVTGANSGFGLETARLLAASGYRVHATYRDKKRSQDLFKLARTLPVLPLRMDVTQEASILRGMKEVERSSGHLDLLVNNAGSVKAGFLEDLDDRDWEGQFEVNVFGPLRVLRRALPLLRPKGGKVLNMGSISGRVVFPGLGAYAASKFALRSLTEGLRMELRPLGIQVGEIAPGTFATSVMANTSYAAGMRKDRSPYAPFFDQVRGTVQKEFKKAAPASKVAELVLALARARRVPPVTLAGSDAKALAFLKKRLPGAWFEGLFRMAFPWSRFPKG